MTYHDAYIGDLDDFDWECADGNNTNTPARLSPYFPPVGGRYHDGPFWRIRELLESGKLTGKQTDWGAWTAKANKEQILAFIEDCYRGQYTNPSEMPHLFKTFEQLLKSAKSLEDGKLYALVATEF